MDSNWRVQLYEMNRSKRGRPFAYPDLLMGSIAYLRWMIGKGVRITEGITDEILGKIYDMTAKVKACQLGD